MNLKQLKTREQEILSKSSKYLDLFSHEVLNDNVLVYPVIIEQQDEIALPQQYEDKASYGIVVGIGQGRLMENGSRTPMTVNVGDFILFAKYSATKERTNGIDLLYIREEDIISRI